MPFPSNFQTIFNIDRDIEVYFRFGLNNILEEANTYITKPTKITYLIKTII